MSNPDLPSATTELVRAVLALIGLPRADPLYRGQAQAVLALAQDALAALSQAPAEATAPVTPAPNGPGQRGLRIAELAAGGMGVREIARQLGVNASTVSRRLRSARAENAARNRAIPSATGG